MQNHEENIISYIDNCDHTEDGKAIFIDLLTQLINACHEDSGNDSPKTLKQLTKCNRYWAILIRK
jgi:hypothetical protein